MSLLKKIAKRISLTDFARKALNERADLSAFKETPTARIFSGLFLIALSYLIGWPAVALFGILSIYFNEPLLLIIGGPAIYGVSHLVFIAGMYLAGSRYGYVVLRWATRKALVKILGDDVSLD